MIGGSIQWIRTIHTIRLCKTTGRPSRSSAVTEKGYRITIANTTSMSLTPCLVFSLIWIVVLVVVGHGRSWSVVSFLYTVVPFWYTVLGWLAGRSVSLGGGRPPHSPLLALTYGEGDTREVGV